MRSPTEVVNNVRIGWGDRGDGTTRAKAGGPDSNHSQRRPVSWELGLGRSHGEDTTPEGVTGNRNVAFFHFALDLFLRSSLQGSAPCHAGHREGQVGAE